MQWSGEPALYTKFHFGKYRGRRYDEIAASDPDYLRWIIEKSELEEGIKHSARLLARSFKLARRQHRIGMLGAGVCRVLRRCDRPCMKLGSALVRLHVDAID